MLISVIFPAFNEQENLPILYELTKKVALSIKEHEFEFVFVDDCSTDSTPDVLASLREKDDRVQIIRFARNCGGHSAISAGLTNCNGDVAIILSADLQDPPEVIPLLLEEHSKGFNVVWGVREKRKGESLLTIINSRIFYYIINKWIKIHRPKTGADIVLVDRKVINEYNGSTEKSGSVFMMIAWMGFNQAYINYIKEKRHSGSSKWNFWKRVKIFLDVLISYSYAPLRLMSLFGALSACLGLLYGLLVFFNALQGIPVRGWATLMIVVLLLGGFQMIMMGMLGEYIWRIYDEIRKRPRYIIEVNTLKTE